MRQYGILLSICTIAIHFSSCHPKLANATAPYPVKKFIKGQEAQCKCEEPATWDGETVELIGISSGGYEEDQLFFYLKSEKNEKRQIKIVLNGAYSEAKAKLVNNKRKLIVTGKLAGFDMHMNYICRRDQFIVAEKIVWWEERELEL